MMEPLKHYEVQQLVRTSTLSATERAVLLEVSFAASGEEATCYQAQATIADNTALSERTVRRDLGVLEAAGILVVIPDRSRRSTTYRVCAAAIPARGATTPAPPAADPAPHAATPAQAPAPRAANPAPGARVPGMECQGTRHHVPVRPAPRAANTFLDPIPDPFRDARDARARDERSITERQAGRASADSRGPPARASPRFSVTMLPEFPTLTAPGDSS